MIAFTKTNHTEDIEIGINELVPQNYYYYQQSQQLKHQPEYKKKTQTSPCNAQTQRDIYNKMPHFQILKITERKKNLRDGSTFIRNIMWENSVLIEDQKRSLPNIDLKSDIIPILKQNLKGTSRIFVNKRTTQKDTNASRVQLN